MQSTLNEQRMTGDDRRWQAVTDRDVAADGRFDYAVKTTGVYCRPSCGARLARRENVSFYATAREAERAGFRACKRCRPDRMDQEAGHAAAVTKACAMIAKAEEAPSLEELAAAAGMSVSHFHRVFKSLTGVTPKGYVTAHRAGRVRNELRRGGTVTGAVYKAGFNSGARFYATSAKVLGMKAREYQAGGAGRKIRFAVGECSLGAILVAASDAGVCAISLGDDPERLVRELQDRFSRAELVGGDAEFEKLVAQAVALVERPDARVKLPLDVQGTAFQQRVWEKLREIPCGETRTYSELARQMGRPNATRAVAGACAANAIAVAIPCHRVVRRDGAMGGYRWGVERKERLLEAERKGAR
jgi:AraC family transcriptional regulator of adaptative response/methylated-DNA-[protein]-cysteine methyltransferase